MKNKKFIVCVVICVLGMGLLSSCAIDKKCPAYTQANAGIPVNDKA